MGISKYIGYKTETRTGSATITDYLGKGVYLLTFEDGFVKKAQLTDIKKGYVWNPYQKTVFGVGYMGDGQYKANTPEFIAWNAMMSRCYSSHAQKSRPDYLGSYVCDAWHNFQVFADWYTSHKNYGKKYKLDKDLRVFGNKQYSPETCDLIPNSVNVLITNSFANRGEYPVGVSFCKKRLKFVAQCHLGQFTRNGNRRQTHLGYFSTKEEAFQVYKINKEAHVKRVAEQNKEEISEQIYNNLMKWEVNFDVLQNTQS